MDLTASGRTWDAAQSPAAARLARRYEAAWRGSNGHRPDPRDFLPIEPAERPGALLAVLRTDLSLRWEANDKVSVEWYRERHPDLAGEALVGLIYEEFCLREDAGQTPAPGEYLARFPEVAKPLRRVLEIHDLVGSGHSTALRASVPSAVPFPEVGQTIAGFHLVEELGRGSFARVFRAEERQLADRPVALKVARSGSREPQTLARLQHTNIVPLHSYRIDPATGLHLLCMPYFGRVTLAQILADPAIRAAGTGAELLAALDRLQPASQEPPQRPGDRQALARRSYARAIAWWGARLAEALQHAHDRGVLHRDIKPSNVLVTGDGMPMLLDFNLAREPLLDDPAGAPGTLGGTLAYMAPEHLEALAEGELDGVDGRADLYALGVVLYEALGTRPFQAPSGSLSLVDTLLRAAEERRQGPPPLRRYHPEVPPALDAVVRMCLAPDPADRYASAAELAADLQAVADDDPLSCAREPQPSRSLRWLRRNRRRIAVAVPLVAALAFVAYHWNRTQVDRLQQKIEITQWLADADVARERGDFPEAINQFDRAAQSAKRHGFDGLYAKAREKWNLTKQTREIRDRADQFFQAAEPLKFCLLGFGGDKEKASQSLMAELDKFYVFANNPDWTKLDDVSPALLDDHRRSRLIDEVNELMFMWVVASVDPRRPRDLEVARRAVSMCDRALVFAVPRGPWEALRARFAAQLDPQAPRPQIGDNPEAETSARACFQWALLSNLEGRRDWAIAWLERANRLEPNHYWYQFTLAYHHERAGNVEQALQHCEQAVALDSGSPWARRNRAGLYMKQGAWDHALDDLHHALQTTRDFDFLAAHLDLGYVHQALGDARAARAEYDHVIVNGPGTPYARAARLNRAKLDFDAGRLDRSRTEYDALLAEKPDDAPARLARAMLALRVGQAGQAEADLTALIQSHPPEPDRDLAGPDFRLQALALRAVARLALGQAREAAEDAEQAYRLEASPAHERLWHRTVLALGWDRDLLLDDPDEVAYWPAGGTTLLADLKIAAERLRPLAGSEGEPALRAGLARAVLLSALGDDRAALQEANQLVARAPVSALAYLVRARIHRRAGDRPAALADVDHALALEADSPQALEVRGRLRGELGQPAAALADFDRALRRGAQGSVYRARARVLMALGRVVQAVADWSRALEFDPQDARAYLGRARAFQQLHQTDQALADLEQAAGWAGERPDLLLPVLTAYVACLPDRLNRFPRVLALTKAAWHAAQTPSAIR